MILRRASAFTLVELMVVIGILALLASMLLVAIPGVREKANSARCMHNLKQLYLAISQYVADERVYPEGTRHVGRRGDTKSRASGTTDKGRLWWGNLLTNYWMRGTADPYEKERKMQIVRCPTAAAHRGNYKDWSLLMNLWLQGKAFGGAGAGVTSLPTERVSRTILAGDGHWEDASVWGEAKWEGIDPYMNTPDFEHTGGCNILFCDGHVARMRPPKVLEKYYWFTDEPLPGGQNE